MSLKSLLIAGEENLKLASLEENMPKSARPFRKRHEEKLINLLDIIEIPLQWLKITLRRGPTEGGSYLLRKKAKLVNQWKRIYPELKAHLLGVKPVIVFQMGKVGSKTVQASVIYAYQKRGISIPVYHPHLLNNIDQTEMFRKEERIDPGLGLIQRSRELLKEMEKNPAQRWNIITLVRDPIARNVGSFFDNLHEFIPDWHEQYTKGNLSIKDIQHFFLNVRSIHNGPATWFDEQLKPVFDIDVFIHPFPANLGYKIYKDNPRAHVLLIRLEDLNRVASQAMKEFLGFRGFQLVNTNIGEDKYYAKAYREFKNTPLPENYINRIYSTKFARHFYTPEELISFADQWRKEK